MEMVSVQVGDGEHVGHPGLLPLKGGVHHLALPPPGDRGRRSPPKHGAGDDQGLAEPVGAQPATHLPAPAVQDHRLLRRHVHRQVHPRDRRRLDLEVHPAPVHPTVLRSNPLDDKQAWALVRLEEASTLQGGVVGPVPSIRETPICKWRRIQNLATL